MYEIMARLINARYSVPSWEWAIVSALFGITVFIFAIQDPKSVANLTGALPLGGRLWAPLLTLSAICAMFGMAKNKLRVVRFSAFASFMLWLFGDISWWVSSPKGWLNVLIFGSWLTLFWFYKYLASFAREHAQL